jgi:hypothetical protein
VTGSRIGPVLLVAAVGLGACEREASLREPSAEGPASGARVTVTKEEAALLASGELIRVYGLEADPVPVQVLFEQATLDGEPVWEVRALVSVTVGGERVERQWTIWVGQEDERPAVLRSVGPVE